jgi:phenylacetate-CoA ligase
MYRLFGNVAATYCDAARAHGLDPAEDLNLRIAGDHPSEQYLMASSGLEALPLLGSACDERDGAHLAEDLAIVEVIDPSDGRVCGHGERGNLVVTVLEKDNFLLRYDLEDVVRWNTKVCPCGETHRRLFYEGRVRDITRVGAKDILPIDVALVLYEFPEVAQPSAEYQIVRSRAAADVLQLRVEFDPAAAQQIALGRRLQERFRTRLGIETSIDLTRRGELPRFSYKAARVVDE